MPKGGDSHGIGEFAVARNPDVRLFVEKLNRLREAVDSVRLQPGVGYTLSRSANGTVLSISKGGGGVAAPEPPFPWQVTQTTIAGRIHFIVQAESLLDGDYVDGLGVPQDTGLVSLEPGTAVYVYVRLLINSSLAVVSKELKSSLEPPASILPIGNGPQEEANIVLATLASGGIVQAVRTHLQTVLVNSAGYPALVPVQTYISQ